jgi:hypothetical protein
MTVPDAQFQALIGASPALITELKELFAEIPETPGPGSAKIALRITQGPSNACIDFHCDGGYATGTVQVALNEPSQYKGGRLCYFVGGQLHVLERPAGSVVQHPARVLHAVTALTEGTRKSLFVVDQSNGLGEGGVVEVTNAHVQAFLAARAPAPARAPSVAPRSVLNTSKINVTDLRKELADRGLDSKGNKPVLVARLDAALEREGESRAGGAAGGAAGGPTVKMCEACGATTSNYILLPCGHLCMCAACAAKLQQGDACPSCGKQVQTKHEVFL